LSSSIKDRNPAREFSRSRDQAAELFMLTILLTPNGSLLLTPIFWTPTVWPILQSNVDTIYSESVGDSTSERVWSHQSIQTTQEVLTIKAS
jgi:hypothetical protein